MRAMQENTSIADWPRPVVHWEIVARDAEHLANFYRHLFNWRIGEGDIKQVPAGLGAPEPGPGGHLRTGDRPGVSLYVQVRDKHESISLAESLGGKLLRAPFNAPGPTTLCSILDPEDNRIVLIQQ
jgi:predicted enzyme related to lactoylglutathione lyase